MRAGYKGREMSAKIKSCPALNPPTPFQGRTTNPFPCRAFRNTFARKLREMLAPGEYKVIADGSKAKFQQGNKVVAEIPCTLKDFAGKINETTFVIDNNQLTEIQVSGRSKAIEFSSGM